MSTRNLYITLLIIGLTLAYSEALKIHHWEVITLTFEANLKLQNPYASIPVDRGNDILAIDFFGMDGLAKDIRNSNQ